MLLAQTETSGLRSRSPSDQDTDSIGTLLCIVHAYQEEQKLRKRTSVSSS